MLNSCTLMGRMVSDPELRHTNSGTPVTSFTIANDRDFARNGQERETDFIDITAWGKTAEFACKYFQKGMQIACVGRLESQKWVDKAGQNRVSYFINADHLHFAERKQDSQDTPSREEPRAYAMPTRRPDIAAPIFDAIEADDDTLF